VHKNPEIINQMIC